MLGIFQFPKRSWCSPSEPVWYENRCLGVNKLGEMMKEISCLAKLSKIYTNHCVRGTAITIWSEAGLPNRHIMAISGHRNEQSLKSYNSRPSSNQLEQCSNVLSRALVSSHESHTNQSFQQHVLSQSSFTTTSNTVSHSSTLSNQAKWEFGKMFSGCSIGSVNISFNKDGHHS